MIPNQLRQVTDKFFIDNKHRFDFSHADGCGKYMEALIPYLQKNGFEEAGFLRKYGTQTQYNGHAVDALLWKTDSINLLQSVDVVKDAESNHASAGFSVDEPRYQHKDWLQSPMTDTYGPPENKVPYVPYNENGFQRLKRMLIHDYGRKPQGADFDVSVWAGRYFHNCYMGPNGHPLGEQGALERIKPELCESLKISNDGYLG